MAYKVTLEGSNDSQMILFRNHDDALQFASMAVEYGTFQDYHYEKKDGEHVKVYDEQKPLEVRIARVEE